LRFGCLAVPGYGRALVLCFGDEWYSLIDTIIKFLAALWKAITAHMHSQARGKFDEEQRQTSQGVEVKREEKQQDVADRSDEQAQQDISKWFRD